MERVAIYWSDEFEAGRQEVIKAMERITFRQLKFIESVKGDSSINISEEKRSGIEQTLRDTLETLELLGNKRRTINQLASQEWASPDIETDHALDRLQDKIISHVDPDQE